MTRLLRVQRMAKKGISYFHMELSAFELTPEYDTLLKCQPNTYFIWEDYALYGYGSEGLFKPIQIHVTPTSIQIFKEHRKLQNQFIYNWSGVVKEFDGIRFCESMQEFQLLTAIGDWFREQLIAMQEAEQEYAFIAEIDFVKRFGVTNAEHLSFQQKLKSLKRDIKRFYGYDVELGLTEYFTNEYWYGGNCATMSIATPTVPLTFQFELYQQKVTVYCQSAVIIDEHPMLLKVVRMLMKERAYGQVAQVLLKEEALKFKGGAK